LAPHNRWASAKVLREKWLHHIENSLYRPVLLID
jgi:general secretion pathway protein A